MPKDFLMRISKLLTAVILPGLLSIALPSPARADTVLTYTDTADIAITVTFDFTGPTLAGLAPGTDITSEITGFSMTYPAPGQDEGGFPLADNSISSQDVQIGTDSLGNVTSWNITATLFASYPAFSGENPTDFYCNFGVSVTSSGNSAPLTTDNDAGFCPAAAASSAAIGTWSPQFQGPTGPSTPEPQSSALLGAGVVGLISLASIRKFQQR